MKLFLIIVISLVCLPAVSQSSEKTASTYVSLSGGYTSEQQGYFTIETGCWHNIKPVMFAINADINPKKFIYPGLKVYYLVLNEWNYYLYPYLGAKVNLTPVDRRCKQDGYIVEYGLCNYIQFSKKWYVSVGVGLQSGKGFTNIPGIYTGLNFVW